MRSSGRSDLLELGMQLIVPSEGPRCYRFRRNEREKKVDGGFGEVTTAFSWDAIALCRLGFVGLGKEAASDANDRDGCASCCGSRCCH